MAGFRGQIIKNLLRLLTPEEISELTQNSSGSVRIDLTNLVQLEFTGKDYRDYEEDHEDKDNPDSIKHEAKILDINQALENKSSSEKDIELNIGERSKIILDSFYKECKEMEKNILGPKRRPKRRSNKNRKQMSSFIIEEKEKLNDSYSKLKKVEIIDLYQKNASVDVELEKNNKEDLSKSSQSGILVNKKQA